MDSVFSSDEAARLDFLQSLFHSYGCAYICLWSYSSSSNRLLFLDGFYDVPNHQASASMGSVDHRLFDQYKGLEFDVTSDDDHVPGLAFRNHHSYLELHQSDLLRLARTDIQRQFFREARIKTAVFMGCSYGEIELGFSSQGENQTDAMNLLPEEFSRQPHPMERKINPPSSSLRSLSTTESPEYTSLLFGDIPGTSLLPEMLVQPGNEHDAIIKAILHVISSPSSNDSTSYQQNLPNDHPEGASAFKRYRSSQMGSNPNFPRQSLLRRSFQWYRGLHLMRMRERTRPTTTQLLHMISERRRREKLNENFQALRSLLPPATKKDKASILTAAKETLSSLMAEIEKMTKRNQQVEAQMKAMKLTSQETKISSSNNERLRVRVSHVPGSSSSEERFIDLHVSVRGKSYSQIDLLIPLLEFLKGVQQVSLMSMDANTHIAQGAAINEATLRLKIEESEWDEAAFAEAVRRVVADLAQ